MMTELDLLRGFKRYSLGGGVYIRSNEVQGDRLDIVYHKNKTTLETYHKLFESFTPKTILEIGVKEGGSLVLWSVLFPGAHIIGVDNDINQISNSCIKHFVDNDIMVIHADCLQVDIVNPILSRKFPQGIDLIVDDGSHTLDNIKTNFSQYFHRVTEGGAYVIEDWKILHPTHRKVLLDHLSDNEYELHENMIVLRKKWKN